MKAEFDKSLRSRQLFWAVGLSVVFLAVYGTTNTLASHLPAVPSVYFEFEKYMPFVPFMIVPYMSIDLFFFFAPFLCADRKQMRVHAMRIICAICVAGTIFTLMPLKYGFDRPEVHSVFAPVFKLLWSTDLPFNLAPSLHLALRTILWPVYVRNTRGYLRAAVKIWFIGIGVSTLLVHQHHLIDVVAGVVLGFLALYLFDERATKSTDTRHHWKHSAFYALGAAACAALAALLAPFGVVLLWPALSLSLVSIAYAGVGESVFRKFPNGHMATAAKWVFEPYLLGTKLYAWLHTRADAAYVEIAPNLIIGRRPTNREAIAITQQFPHLCVIDLAAEFQGRLALRACEHYVNLPMLDLVTPTVDQLNAAVREIQSNIDQRVVFVHCSMGYYRSALVAAAYLLHAGSATTVEHAMQQVLRVRPNARFDQSSAAILTELLKNRGMAQMA